MNAFKKAFRDSRVDQNNVDDALGELIDTIRSEGDTVVARIKLTNLAEAERRIEAHPEVIAMNIESEMADGYMTLKFSKKG